MPWFARTGLRVLMYHKVSPGAGDALTVTSDQLASQLRWIQRQDFPFVSVTQVLAAVRGGAPLPRDAVLVTFDDAFLSTFEHAWPVLASLRLSAAVFVPTAFIGATSAWDVTPEPLMQVTHLRTLEAAGWEIGLHSHRHENYAELGADRVAADLKLATETLRQVCARPLPALAYPYGRPPASGPAREALQAALRGAGIEIAFRIGNRINPQPLRRVFEVERIGPRGDCSAAYFRRQIRWGRLW